MTSRPGAPPGNGSGPPDGRAAVTGGQLVGDSVDGHNPLGWQRHERRRDQLVIRRLRRDIPAAGGGWSDRRPDPADEAEFARLMLMFARQFSHYREPAGAS